MYVYSLHFQTTEEIKSILLYLAQSKFFFSRSEQCVTLAEPYFEVMYVHSITVPDNYL